ncbi:hypothetical protein EOPP23_12490 [Endozoicomonas sp. OPT23]|nr:hypothetical protein [Endozoicomonas sp. OPT23]
MAYISKINTVGHEMNESSPDTHNPMVNIDQFKMNTHDDQQMYVRVTPSIPILPFNDKDDLSPEEERRLMAKTPFIDFRQVLSRSEIVAHLQALIAHYFQLPIKLVTPEADLVDEIERHIWARELEVNFEEVEYGKILCGRDDNGELTGGLSDRGLLMGFFMAMDFADGVGVCVVYDEDSGTFPVAEGDYGNYADCKNINELADILEAVRLKLMAVQS